MNVSQYEALQKAQYFQQQAEEARHDAAFIAQSTYGHTPPVNVHNQIYDRYEERQSIRSAVRASVGLGAPVDPAIERIRYKAAVDQAGTNELRQAVSEMRQLLAGAIREVDRRAQVQRSAARQQTGPQVRVHRGGFQQTPGVTPSDLQAYEPIRSIVRRSVGL